MATLLLATIPANAFWSAALTMLGGYIDSKLFGPHVTQEVGKMSDLQMQTASYGAPIPLILGTCRSTGNVIWSTKFVEHTKKPISSQFDILVDQGIITLDHLIKRNSAGKVVEKGPLFKINPKGLNLLFPPSERYMLV